MKIAVSGSTGLVGTALRASLRAAGDEVVPLTRKESSDGILWKPLEGVFGPGLEAVDAVVHLAGAPIGDGPWTEEAKARIRDSRVVGTRNLAAHLATLPPRVLVSTSAIGIYGDRGDTVLEETSEPGVGFLADVCKGWEEGTDAAAQAGWRVATVRVGLAISAQGGLLEPLVPMFRWGMGGPVAGGAQWMSWIHLPDLVRLFEFALRNPVSGVFNGTAPNPVTNRTFTRSLGSALNRPAFVPAPAFAVRAGLGREKADELVLASQRVLPRRAVDAGFDFAVPTLDEALRIELG